MFGYLCVCKCVRLRRQTDSRHELLFVGDVLLLQLEPVTTQRAQKILQLLYKNQVSDNKQVTWAFLHWRRASSALESLSMGVPACVLPARAGTKTAHAPPLSQVRPIMTVKVIDYTLRWADAAERGAGRGRHGQLLDPHLIGLPRETRGVRGEMLYWHIYHKHVLLLLNRH